MTDYLSRESWDASVDLADARVRTPVDEVWVHHSVTSPDDDLVYDATDDVAADMRELERIGKARFGRFSYSWAVHPSGWVGEGAGLTVGAHTAGRNSTSFGIVAIGNYQAARPPRPIIDGIAGCIADLVRAGHLLIGYRLGGHRSAPGAATACPGQYLLAELPEIRATVDRLLAPPPPPPPGGAGFPGAVHAVRRPGGGTWVLGSDGGVGAYRGAPFYGSLPDISVVATAVAMLPTPSGAGYWIMTTDGGIFTFGDAGYHGSYPGLAPEDRQGVRRFVALASIPHGYVELADDGADYAFA